VFDLNPVTSVRIVEKDVNEQVGKYLGLVASTRDQDVRRMAISTAGEGDRDLLVSYISEVPVWKCTYRIVVPKEGKPLLQGWAIVDNTVGEDWKNVEFSGRCRLGFWRRHRRRSFQGWHFCPSL
jgi:hypothetical protein